MPTIRTRPGTRVCFWSDWHVPYQDDSLIERAVEIIRDFKPDIAIDGGDLLDADGFASFSTEPEGDWFDAVQAAGDILARVRDACPEGCQLRRMDGNHEYRGWKKAGAVPRYYRRSLQPALLAPEFAHWIASPYRKDRDGILEVGPFLFYHGSRSGGTSNELEACEVADIFGGIRGQLVVLGHTHECIEPTTAMRTRTIPLNLQHANTGTLCDVSRMDYAANRYTERWCGGVFCGEILKDGEYAAEVVRV